MTSQQARNDLLLALVWVALAVVAWVKQSYLIFGWATFAAGFRLGNNR